MLVSVTAALLFPQTSVFAVMFRLGTALEDQVGPCATILIVHEFLTFYNNFSFLSRVEFDSTFGPAESGIVDSKCWS